MHALSFLVISCILITIACSASDFDVSLFNENSLSFPDQDSLDFLGEDSLNFLDDPSIQTMNSLDQSTDSDIDNFLDDQVSQTVESDLDFFLAGDIDCDAFDAEDTQLFAKRRRGAACKTPTTDTAEPEKPKEESGPTNDPLNFKQFLKTRPSLADFRQSSEASPAIYFITSRIPVCSKALTIAMGRQPSAALQLLDVDPGAFTCASEFASFNLMTKG